MKYITAEEFYNWIFVLSTLIFAHLVIRNDAQDIFDYILMGISLGVMLLVLYKSRQSKKEDGEKDPPGD